jgi:hypothetical protein
MRIAHKHPTVTGLFLCLAIICQLAEQIARGCLYTGVARIAALLAIAVPHSYEMTFVAIFAFDFPTLDRG